MGRVGLEPPLELIDEAVPVPRLAGQPVGAAQGEPMLVPVQLPDDLVIADRRVQERHLRPVPHRRPAIVHRIADPVDAPAVVGESKRRIAEDVEAARERALCTTTGVGGGGREGGLDETRDVVSRGGRHHEA